MSFDPRLIGASPHAIDPGDYAKAILNILEDSSGEKYRLEESQRAMLNLLEDFDVERLKAEAANRELRVSFEALRFAKEATEAANRELEAFSYSVSHDLRSPLRSIAGFSQVLLEDYLDRLDARGKDSLERIIAATNRMGRLIDDLLNLSRMTRTEMKREHISLNRIAENIAVRLKKAQPERDVQFVISEGLDAWGDEHLLTVVLENLLGNAWKFSGNLPHTVIEFGNTLHGDEPEYFVKDNGAGFDPAYAGKLFNPFQRLHGANEFPGTGIGLATVKRIVNRHGGRIRAEGEVGKGATVYFTLGENKW